MNCFVRLIFSLVTAVSSSVRLGPYGGTIIAFGNTDESSSSLSPITRFIEENSRKIEPLDFVGLLGNSLLQFPRLAGDLETSFLPVLGDTDRGCATTYDNDNRMIFPGLTFMSPYLIEEDRDELLCVWAIDAYVFDDESYAILDEEFAENFRHWNIMITHIPFFSFGESRNQTRVITFREKILPIIQKNKIHLILSGHDHSTQVISDSTISALMLIVGAPVRVERDSVDTNFSQNPPTTKLLWYNDSEDGIVLRITYSIESILWELVNVRDNKVSISGLIDAI